MKNHMMEIPNSTPGEAYDDELPPSLSLDERSFQGQCKAAALCTVALAYAGAEGIKKLGGAAVDQAAAHALTVGKIL